MEKDDEITGVEGSHLDFGARIYDSRIGRWLSRDPMANNYPNQSAYNYAVNSPIMFFDPNGEDAIVTIDKSEPNKTTITFSTKVFVTGTGYEKDGTFISDLQKTSDEIFTDWSYTENGHTYIVKYDIKYIDAMGDVARKKTLPNLPKPVVNAKTDATRHKKFPIPIAQEVNDAGIDKGDNYVIITDKPSVPGQSSTYTNKSMAEIDQAYTVQGEDNKRSITIMTTIHEVGHLIGYADRYTSEKDSKGDAVPESGYENDIMARRDDNLKIIGGTTLVHTDARDKATIHTVMTNSDNNPNASEKKKEYSLFKLLKWGNNSEKKIDK
jgi:RHS repeat-associated protein